MQESGGFTQEKANGQEANRLQNPCAQHSLPGHRQRTAGTLLVAVTLAQNQSHTCSRFRSRAEVICFIFFFILKTTLFSTFGELKTVRLPKKAVGSGSHRGFGFIDFITKQDAKVCGSSRPRTLMKCLFLAIVFDRSCRCPSRKPSRPSATAPICTGDAWCWSGPTPRSQWRR